MKNFNTDQFWIIVRHPVCVHNGNISFTKLTIQADEKGVPENFAHDFL